MPNQNLKKLSKNENNMLKKKIDKIEDMPDSDDSYWESECADMYGEEDDYQMEEYEHPLPSIKSSDV